MVEGIDTKELSLRRMTEKENRALWRKVVYDPAITDRVFSYDEEQVDTRFAAEAATAEWNPVFGVFTRKGEVIGFVRLPCIVYSEKRCELEVFIANDSYRGKGYGTAAAKAALRLAHEKLSIDRVYASAAAGDTRLMRVLEKAGFVRGRDHGTRAEFIKRV